MKLPAWPQLRLRLMLPIAIFSLLAIATSYSVVYGSKIREEDYVQAAADRFQAELVDISRTVELLGNADNPATAESLVRLSAAHDVAYALLVAGNGQIIQSTMPRWQNEILKDVLPTHMTGLIEEARLTRSLIFRKLDEHRYLMAISYSEHASMALRNLDRGVIFLVLDLQKALAEVRQKAVLERFPDLLVWLLGGVLLMQFLNRWLAAPIERLRQEMTDWAVDSSHPDGTASGAWEVRSLAISFHELKERLDLQLTQLEKSRADAEKASRAKGEFVASMSHELRTPLNIILGYCQIMAEDQSVSGDLRGQIQEVGRASNHLLALVSDIMDLSRIEAGKLSLNRETFSLMEVLEGTRAIASVYAHERNIEIRLHNDTEGGEIFLEADPTRVRQIVLNLLTNAIKYGPPDAFVDVDVKCPDLRTVRIEVRDYGAGISSEMQPRLFLDPFERLGRELGTVEGVGIGLVVCSRLISAMGGRIGEYNALEGGAIFWVEIPGVRASLDREAGGSASLGPESSVHLEAQQSLSLGGKKVLIAEDNPVNQQMMRVILGKEGCELKIVATGEEAVDAYKHGNFDIILMDCEMPVMDGYAATRRIRDLESEGGLARVPIIAITANALEGDSQRAIAAGMDSYIAKPLKLVELRSILWRLIG